MSEITTIVGDLHTRGKLGPVAYLYGDSSPSPFEVNFIDLLGKALDCAVELLAGDRAIAENKARARELDLECQQMVIEIGQVKEAVHEVLAPLYGEGVEGPASDCASAVDRRAEALVREHAAGVRTRADEALAGLARANEREIERCRKSLERLLLEYPLPDAVEELRLSWAGKEAGYSAEIRGVAPYEVETSVAVSIPEGHPFASAVYVKDFARDLLVHVPARAGWLRRRGRAKIRRLGKLFVGELRSTSSSMTLALWQKQDPATEKLRVKIERTGGRARVSGHADTDVDFDVDPGDRVELERFERSLRESVAGLSRIAPAEIKIDGEPLDERGPRELVSRLIEAMAPTIAEIAQRSASTRELVLREPIAGGRRTEIFATKESLAARLRALPELERALFEPLGLGPVVAPQNETTEVSEASIEILGDIEDVAIRS